MFYKRRHIRHFDEYTNSCGEGTNNHIKNFGIASKPNIGIDKASAILVKNGERSVYKQLNRCSRIKVGTMSWQPLTCCNKLVDVGASLLSHQWTFADNYECIKISSTEYKVISLNQSCQSKVNGSFQNAADVLPKFLRI